MPQEIEINDLAILLSNRNTIPIIGFEMLRLRKENGLTLSFLEFLAFEYLRKYGYREEIKALQQELAAGSDPFTAEAKAAQASLEVDFYKTVPEIPFELVQRYLRKKLPHARSGIDIIHSLYHCISFEKKDAFKTEISRLITSYRLNSNIYSPVRAPLVHLAKIKYFKFYVNATFLRALQMALKGFRLQKDEPLDVYEYSVLGGAKNIELEREGDWPVNDKISNLAIYNLFGVHDQKPHNYVLNEADFLQLLLDMSKNEKNKFSTLEELLKSANLLFIGCNFTDWFLRFFLRIFTNKREFEKTILNPRFLVDYGDYINTDNGLVVFMDNYSIRTNRLPIEEFIEKLYKACQNNDPDSVEKSIYNNYVFISYCSDDKALARKIRKQLEEANCDSLLFSEVWEGVAPVEGSIWFDDQQLVAGQNIDASIGKAIDDCAVFIPIVSAAVEKKENTERYFWKEWDFGCKRNKNVFPVYVGNADLGMLQDVIKKVNLREAIVPMFSQKAIKGADLSAEAVASDAPLPPDFVERIRKEQSSLRLKTESNGTNEPL